MDKTIDEMLALLDRDGAFVIENYLGGDDLKNIHDETKSLCETEAGHYEFGRNYRGPSLNKFDKESSIRKVFDSGWMKDLHSKYNKSKGEFGFNIFATHDYISNKGLARNGWLHFDRIWCLKFFIYLTDITEDSGAFFYSPGSVKLGEKLRKSEWKHNQFRNVKNRIKLDYKDMMDRYPPKPIEAKAGTLIVFDTDTFHKGGIVNSGKERLVVRLHCR
ncbi:phytanoyl-CoA dioxygenase family protein [bacterium]|nr:phytanoyl-CoA dioxygenase family protein [bacterium]